MIFRTETIGVTGSLLVVVCLWALPSSRATTSWTP